jgi:putative transposase
MVRKNFTPEQIINKLREAEVHISQGIPIVEASRKIGVTGQTYYRWRKEYGGLRVDQADLPPQRIPLLKLELPVF